MNFKNFLYATTCVFFAVVLGAAIYEHVAVWPSAFAGPPMSLTMFQGDFKLNAAPFWMSIHPINLALFIATMILHWKTSRKKYVLVPLVGYVAILIATSIFFVPTLLNITNTPYSTTVNEELRSLGQLWINLSLVRAFVIFILAIILVLGLTRSEEKGTNTAS